MILEKLKINNKEEMYKSIFDLLFIHNLKSKFTIYHYDYLFIINTYINYITLRVRV